MHGQDYGQPDQYPQQGSGQQGPREQWPPQYQQPASWPPGQRDCIRRHRYRVYRRHRRQRSLDQAFRLEIPDVSRCRLPS
jgi:hypothetical protein